MPEVTSSSTGQVAPSFFFFFFFPYLPQDQVGEKYVFRLHDHIISDQSAASIANHPCIGNPNTGGGINNERKKPKHHWQGAEHDIRSRATISRYSLSPPRPLSELQVDRRCECVPIKPSSRSTSLPSLSSSHWHFSPPLELASFISATLSLAASFSTTHTTGTNGHSYCSGGRSIEDARGSRYVGWTGLATVF